MIESKEPVPVNATGTPVTDQMAVFNHEQVVFCQDNPTGLKAIIAIHDTTLGPAVGGTRMWAYPSEKEAVTDVLRLSRGMTYKNALAGLNIGGGKAVIIGDARTQKSEALLRRFGKFVNSLGGKYITAEDVGMSTRDMEHIHSETKHVVGLPDYLNGGGDPSPVTAFGVFMGMKASIRELTGSDSLSGKRILVQGVGHVGMHLVDLLAREGAHILINDIFEDRIKSVSARHNVHFVPSEEVFSTPVDVYSPCALGATINDETLQTLECAVICGAANNQLANEAKHGEEVRRKGILYAPDYLVNAGGIINCYWEIIGYNRQAAMNQAELIYQTTLDIYRKSASENIPTYLAANRLAEARIEAVGQIRRRR